MQQRIRFELPAAEEADGESFSETRGIDALHIMRGDQPFHGGTHFAPVKVPHLDGKSATEPAQLVNGHPGCLCEKTPQTVLK